MGDAVIAFIFPEEKDSVTLGRLIVMCKEPFKDIPQVKVHMARGRAADTIKFFVETGELPVDEDASPTYEPTDRTYRKKPVQIEAVQLCWKNWSEVCDFVGGPEGVINDKNPAWNINEDEVSDTCGESEPFIAFKAMTMHGDEAVFRHGDWIIPDAKPGTFYPCKPEIFEATYEKVKS